MNEAVKWAAAYIVVGLVVATLFGCWCRFGRLYDHLSEDELEGLWVALLLWPFVVLAFPVAMVMAVTEEIKTTKWWKKLPDSKDLHPMEWLFCWPVKLYELWRRRHEREGREHEHEH